MREESDEVGLTKLIAWDDLESRLALELKGSLPRVIIFIADAHKKFIDGLLTPVNCFPSAWLSPVVGIQWRYH